MTLYQVQSLNCEYARKEQQKPQVRNQRYSDFLELILGADQNSYQHSYIGETELHAISTA
jgi:hypothetical protein